MKRILVPFLASVVLLVSCGPTRHSIHVEMRHPSRSGIELAGKSISFVYLENENAIASAFAEGLADGFASSLEQDYGTGNGSVGVFRMNSLPGSVYSSRDSLVNLLLELNTDVVFLLDTLAMGEMSISGATSVSVPVSSDSSFVSTGSLPFTMRLYCYDSMNREDKVFSFSGSSVAVPFAYSDGKQPESVIRERAEATVPEVGFEAGNTVASSFRSQWKHEQYSILYFDSAQWFDAMLYADQYQWKSAMDIWLKLLDTRDLFKRSCAAYNIAVAAYMLGDYHLASEWLDRSDADNKLSLSDAMRKRIDARK